MPRSVEDKEISPPPTKRRRLTLDSEQQPAPEIHGAHSVSIFSWNVNGVAPLLQRPISFARHTAEFPLRVFLKRHTWPHFLCLQEVKIRRDDHATQRKLDLAANAGNQPGEPTYTTHFSLPRDKFNAIGFGGKVHGVATLIRDDIARDVTAIRRPDWDLEGRVLIVELRQRLAVVNGYWVNGTVNPYKDPQTGEVTGTRHDHKLRFHQYILGDSLALEKRGFSVILIGDMNVARYTLDGHPKLRTSPTQHVKNRYDFNQTFFEREDGFRGVDVFRQLHGSKRKYTYHARGITWGSSCDRVDNIVVSRKLVDGAHELPQVSTGCPHTGCIKSTDILDNLQDRGHSDHVPLFVIVDLERLPVSEASAAQHGKSSLADE